MSRTFKLTIAYDGTDFAGWQVQPNQPTVQGKLHRALEAITGQQIHAVGSGRTDSGVHAFGQVASLTIPNWRHSAADLGRALNTQLPETIVIEEVVDAPDRFHAIRDAIGKRYRYQLQIGGTRDAFQFRYRWHLPGPLDVDAMRDAAVRLIGRHDFASFQAAGSQRKTTTRTVRACQLIDQPSTRPDRHDLAIEVEADGFLYNMVRNIVGTLVEVGWGKRTADSIAATLAACDRDAAGQTAPAHGLCLVRVDYDPFQLEPS